MVQPSNLAIARENEAAPSEPRTVSGRNIDAQASGTRRRTSGVLVVDLSLRNEIHENRLRHQMKSEETLNHDGVHTWHRSDIGKQRNK